MQKFLLLAQTISPGDLDIPQPDPEPRVESLFVWVYIFIVAVAVIVIIIAGIRFMTSRGDPQKVTAARNTIIYTVVGLLIAALATAIIRFIAENVS